MIGLLFFTNIFFCVESNQSFTVFFWLRVRKECLTGKLNDVLNYNDLPLSKLPIVISTSFLEGNQLRNTLYNYYLARVSNKKLF